MYLIKGCRRYPFPVSISLSAAESRDEVSSIGRFQRNKGNVPISLFDRAFTQFALEGAPMHPERTGTGGDVPLVLAEHFL